MPRIADPSRGFAAALLGLALCCGGCAGEAAVSAQQAPQPGRGGVLRLIQEAPRSLDPLMVSSAYESFPVAQIFDGLVALDASLNVVPALAQSWRVSRDGRLYTFHLRPDVRFHDGSPLTAQDVVFTLRRVLEPGRAERSLPFGYLTVVQGAREFAAGLRPDLPGLQAVDARTVRIALDQPYPSFLEVLAMDGLRIVPAAAVAAMGEEAFARRPVGTGPFRLVQWADTHLELAPYPDYFGGPPYLEGVRIFFLSSGETDGGFARFARGELDLLEPLPTALQELRGDPGVRLHRYQELTLSFLGLNVRTPPLDDLRVRQAIARALDREAIVALSPETRRLALGILPPGLPAYSPQPKTLPFDPEEARRLLAAAGHPEGKGLPPIAFYTTGRSPAARQIQQRLVEDLRRVGIIVEPREVEWVELAQRIEQGQAPLFSLGWIADLPDPDSFLRTLFETGGVGNYFRFSDRQVDASLARGAAELNPVERARIYREAERRILECVPIVPLYYPVGLVATRAELRGVEPSPMGLSSLALERVWFARSGS